MSLINFYADNLLPRVPSKPKLRAFILQHIATYNKSVYQLNFIFCKDKYLRDLNKESLNHDYNTDILTYDLSHTYNQIIADVYISIDRVKHNAREHNVTYTNELHRVMFHGVLHLLGYKDKTDAEIIIMRKKEDELLNTYFNVPRETLVNPSTT